jgi:hypothetical protein
MEEAARGAAKVGGWTETRPVSLGLLPSGPDPVGEWCVHRQPPDGYLDEDAMDCKGARRRKRKLPDKRVGVGRRASEPHQPRRVVDEDLPSRRRVGSDRGEQVEEVALVGRATRREGVAVRPVRPQATWSGAVAMTAGANWREGSIM